MISFIVIGRNEGVKLIKCFNSIFKSIEYSKILEYEVIYVDSKSTDNSVQIAENFNKVRTYIITGYANSAIARNVGAKEANGEYLFFIDGDMELKQDFVARYLKDDIRYNYFTGQLIDHIYDKKWNFIQKKYHYKKIKKSTFVNSTGGIFIIKRELWDKVDGMKTKYKISEDLDFSLRLTKVGHKALRLVDIICIHHTIPRSGPKRLFEDLFNLNLFYYTSVLLRGHLFNPFFYKTYLRQNYSQIIMLLSFLIGVSINPLFFLLYPIVLILRVVFNTTKQPKDYLFFFISKFIQVVIRDFLSSVMIFLFFPKSHKSEYERIDKRKS
jgi:glycosyltransferase involved in cell wall biosynthesis